MLYIKSQTSGWPLLLRIRKRARAGRSSFIILNAATFSETIPDNFLNLVDLARMSQSILEQICSLVFKKP